MVMGSISGLSLANYSDSFSVTLFYFCLRSFPASGSFPVSRLFSLDGQSIGASASVLPMSIRSWFPLRLTGLISLRSRGLSRVFSSTTVWKHQFLAEWRSCHQEGSKQPCHAPFSVLNQSCFIRGPNCCFLTRMQGSKEKYKMVWYSHLLKSSPVCHGPHSHRC